MVSDRIVRHVLKPVAFFAALAPAGYLLWAFVTEHLSANPLSDITNSTGDWTLRFLCLALAVTPLRRMTGWKGAVRFRRMLGLFAFFYGALHFLTYVVFDRLAGLDFVEVSDSWTLVQRLAQAVDDDIFSRPFITIGFAAFMLMVPLAVTSTAGMIRRLGGRRWQALHRLMYVTCIAGVVHYWWLVRADVRRPITYGALIGLLLVFRVYWVWLRTSTTPATGRSPGPTQNRAVHSDR